MTPRIVADRPPFQLSSSLLFFSFDLLQVHHCGGHAVGGRLVLHRSDYRSETQKPGSLLARPLSLRRISTIVRGDCVLRIHVTLYGRRLGDIGNLPSFFGSEVVLVYRLSLPGGLSSCTLIPYLLAKTDGC